MRFDRAFGNEHPFGDFLIAHALRGQNHGFPLPFGQAVEHASCFVFAGVEPCARHIVQQLALCGLIELRFAVAHGENPFDDGLWSIGFGNETFRSHFHSALHCALRAE